METNLIKCILSDLGNNPELDTVEIFLPTIPVKGRGTFDIKHKEETYCCSIVEVDWYIEEGKLKHCILYIK